MKRRTALAALLPMVSAPLAWAARPDEPSLLPAPRSLAVDLAAALALGQPLVVMVSLHGCPWCKLVRESYLVPLRREQKLPVVQVDMGSQERLQDFAGVLRTHAELVRAWQVRSAPTVLFFGRDGREVAPRLVGASTDFYGAYLEQRIDQARRAVMG